MECFRVERVIVAAFLMFGSGCSPHASVTPPTATPRGEALQVPDTEFVASLKVERTTLGQRRRVVAIDEAHHNFHTLRGRYRPFAQLLEADGYVVRASTSRFVADSLAGVDVLVVANPLNESQVNLGSWHGAPVSAFTTDEIAALTQWVSAGGRLLLIADHMPFAGAASDLATALGVRWLNAFVMHGNPSAGTGDYPITFRRTDGTLAAARPIDVDSVTTFTGSAFLASGPSRITPLLLLPSDATILLPDTAWRFSGTTRRVREPSALQGGLLEFGAGRVALFGEAAMFSAQLKGPRRLPMGMNAPVAAQNPAFVLQVMHWLDAAAPRSP